MSSNVEGVQRPQCGPRLDRNAWPPTACARNVSPPGPGLSHKWPLLQAYETRQDALPDCPFLLTGMFPNALLNGNKKTTSRSLNKRRNKLLHDRATPLASRLLEEPATNEWTPPTLDVEPREWIEGKTGVKQ